MVVFRRSEKLQNSHLKLFDKKEAGIMKKYIAGFIGTGNMGGALAVAAVNAAGGEKIALYDINKEKAEAFAENVGGTYLPLSELCKNCDYIFLGVKPHIIESLLEEIKADIPENAVIVSMAAGVDLATLKNASGKEKIIRIMPNTPAAVGEGMMLYSLADGINESEEKGFLEAMSKTGKISLIPESQMDAAMAVSGCGPAFVYMFIDALADGAVACGLPRDKALEFAKQTVKGSAAFASVSDKHPEKLKDEVCSPGGTTIEGVLALEDGAFRSTVASAVIAAFEKTKKLKD